MKKYSIISLKRNDIKNTLKAVLLLMSLCTQLTFADTEYYLNELLVGVATDQTILTGDINGDTSIELIAFSVDNEFNKLVTIYEKNELGDYSSQLNLEIYLPVETIAVDLGKLGNKDIIVLYTKNSAIHFDPYLNTKDILVEFQSIYKNPIKTQLPHLDLFKDLNNDGLDDFFIPDFFSSIIKIQNANHEFISTLNLDITPTMYSNNNSISYLLPHIYYTDINNDHINDIAIWMDDGFEVFKGTEQGSFVENAELIELPYKFDFGSTQALEDAMLQNPSNLISLHEVRSIAKFTDFDNDNIPDLAVLETTTESLFERNTVYKIYKGYFNSNNTLVINKEPATTFESKNPMFDINNRDFNNDNHLGLYYSSTKPSIRNILKLILTGKMNIDLFFYQKVDGELSVKEGFKTRAIVNVDIENIEISDPVIIVNDFDGDGLTDLFIQNNGNQLSFYQGINSDELFSKKAVRYELPIPSSQNIEDLIRVLDINGDSKLDILIHYPSSTDENKVVMLMSKE